MKSKKMILVAMLACLFVPAMAQSKESKEEVKGKAIVQVFGNFHTGFGKENDQRGFELERSYLGYQYDFNDGLSMKAVMDIGQSSEVNDYHRIAYIKNAMVTWKKGNFTLNGGLISTTQFNMQEKFWGNRYIMKSFQDLYKFGSSADLGVSASYSCAPWISMDAIIVNGEGYKKVQVNDGLLYGLGVTLQPNKGLTFRVYGGFNEASEDGKKNTYNEAIFLGYENQTYSVGGEYGLMQNASNVENKDQKGISFYGNINLNSKVSLYVRYDELFSKDDWNIKDEQAIITGVQFKLGKYVKLAPNFRMVMPRAEGQANKYSAYISCYFGN